MGTRAPLTCIAIKERGLTDARREGDIDGVIESHQATDDAAREMVRPPCVVKKHAARAGTPGSRARALAHRGQAALRDAAARRCALTPRARPTRASSSTSSSSCGTGQDEHVAPAAAGSSPTHIWHILPVPRFQPDRRPRGAGCPPRPPRAPASPPRAGRRRRPPRALLLRSGASRSGRRTLAQPQSAPPPPARTISADLRALASSPALSASDWLRARATTSTPSTTTRMTAGRTRRRARRVRGTSSRPATSRHTLLERRRRATAAARAATGYRRRGRWTRGCAPRRRQPLVRGRRGGRKKRSSRAGRGGGRRGGRRGGRGGARRRKIRALAPARVWRADQAHRRGRRPARAARRIRLLPFLAVEPARAAWRTVAFLAKVLAVDVVLLLALAAWMRWWGRGGRVEGAFRVLVGTRSRRRSGGRGRMEDVVGWEGSHGAGKGEESVVRELRTMCLILDTIVMYEVRRRCTIRSI